MTSLLSRLIAGEGDTDALLFEAFDALFPGEVLIEHGVRITQTTRAFNFQRLLAIGTPEACVGAAMMLMPEGWPIMSMSETGRAGECLCILGAPDGGEYDTLEAAGKTLSLAISLAAYNAHIDQKGQP